MTKKDLLDKLIEYGLQDKCLLDGSSYTTEPNTCGVYKDGMFYYLYIVSESGDVNIMRKLKNPESLYDFCYNYMGLRRKNPTLEMRRNNGKKNKRY